MPDMEWLWLQTPDEKLAFQAVQDAYKQGINFFDIAPFYGAGSAERVRRDVHVLLMRCDAGNPVAVLHLFR